MPCCLTFIGFEQRNTASPPLFALTRARREPRSPTCDRVQSTAESRFGNGERHDAHGERQPAGVPQVPEQVDDGWTVSPDPYFRPKIFGSWLTVTKIARPNTNPSITGWERKCVMRCARRRRMRPRRDSPLRVYRNPYVPALVRGRQAGRPGHPDPSSDSLLPQQLDRVEAADKGTGGQRR